MAVIQPRNFDAQTGSARDRLIEAAYDLFTAHGISQIGIDRILGEAGCAKASLYNHFKSKSDLALAFLDQRGERWTRNWFESHVRSHNGAAHEKLLFVFDIFDSWFRRPDFEGCPFIKVLLESEKGSAVHRSATRHLARMRDILRELAVEAGLGAPEQFAQAWHMLIKGAIVSATEGHKDAAIDARRTARLVLQGWPRAIESRNSA